ncbi:MAG: 1-acyl-sn-glycerol-3-phosphate acyltransferase [Microthrixaceae bacterium]
MPEVGAGAWSEHRVLRRIVDALAWVTWREVAIDELDATARGPVLLVANHFGGVSDAVVLMSVLPRRPRVLADDQIWKVPGVRNFMDGIGAIPVHRGSRGSTDNTDMFAAAHRALERREMVLIFPEGITREEPSIGKVRSGAARIAIGARAVGVDGIRIVPVGIHYDDKAAFRSAVFVREGMPIDVDAELSAVGVDPSEADFERRAADELTRLIEKRLRQSAPDYDDWSEARALQLGSEAFLRSLEPDKPVPVSLRDRLASWLAARDTVAATDASDDYRRALTQLGVSDAWAAEGRRILDRRRILLGLVWLLMLPYAAIGAVAWVVPAVVAWLVSKVRMAPAVMATVMPLVVLVLFGIATGFWSWIGWRTDGLAGLAAAVVAMPISFAAFVVVVERGLLWWRWSRNRVATFGGRARRLAELRQRTVAAVAAEVETGLRDNLPEAAS